MRAAALLVPVIGAAVLLAGCAGSSGGHIGSPGGSPGASPSTGADAAPASAAEVRIAADAYRTRFDPQTGRIQLSVTNEGDAPITVVRAALDSPALASPLEREKTTVIPAGLTRDLPVPLAGPVCPAGAGEQADPGDPADPADPADPPAAPDTALTARIDVQLSGGGIATIETAAPDRLGQFAAWLEAECFAEAVAARADLSVRMAPDHAARAGDGVVAVELVAARRPAAGSDAPASADEPLALLAVGGTVLLGQLDATGAAVTSIPLDRVIEGGDPTADPTVIRLTLAPARCDPHALADDKQGTRFRVEAAIGDRSGTVVVAADDVTKSAIYRAITTACAVRAGGTG